MDNLGDLPRLGSSVLNTVGRWLFFVAGEATGVKAYHFEDFQRSGPYARSSHARSQFLLFMNYELSMGLFQAFLALSFPFFPWLFGMNPPFRATKDPLGRSFLCSRCSRFLVPRMESSLSNGWARHLRVSAVHAHKRKFLNIFDCNAILESTFLLNFFRQLQGVQSTSMFEEIEHCAVHSIPE